MLSMAVVVRQVVLCMGALCVESGVHDLSSALLLCTMLCTRVVQSYSARSA